VEDSDSGKGHGPTESKRAKPLDNPPTRTGEEQIEDAQGYDYRQFSSNYSGFGPSLATADLKGMLDEAQQTMLMAWYQSGYATGRYQLLCELAEHGHQSNDGS
jgi:hypothetical protein